MEISFVPVKPEEAHLLSESMNLILNFTIPEILYG